MTVSISAMSAKRDWVTEQNGPIHTQIAAQNGEKIWIDIFCDDSAVYAVNHVPTSQKILNYRSCPQLFVTTQTNSTKWNVEMWLLFDSYLRFIKLRISTLRIWSGASFVLYIQLYWNSSGAYFVTSFNVADGIQKINLCCLSPLLLLTELAVSLRLCFKSEPSFLHGNVHGI